MEDEELRRRRMKRMEKLIEFSLLRLKGYESGLEKKECVCEKVNVCVCMCVCIRVWPWGSLFRGRYFDFDVIKGTKWSIKMPL